VCLEPSGAEKEEAVESVELGLTWLSGFVVSGVENIRVGVATITGFVLYTVGVGEVVMVWVGDVVITWVGDKVGLDEIVAVGSAVISG